jgi:hypothetical protein
MVSFPTPRKTDDGPWIFGPNAQVDPVQVVGIEPREHRYHSFRPAQAYTVIHLASGHSIEVFVDADTVGRQVDAAKAKAKAKYPQIRT